MKFARHLLAVLAVVATICMVALVVGDGGGNSNGPGQFHPGPGGKDAVRHITPGHGGPPPGFEFRRFGSGSSGLHLSNVSDLMQTIIIGTGIAWLVVILDRAARRRHRRLR